MTIAILFFYPKAKNLRRKKQFCGTNHKTLGKKVENLAEIFLHTLYRSTVLPMICKNFTKIGLYPSAG